MIKEIIYGLCGNFLFSLCLFTYKKYNHNHYDEIITRLKQLEQMNYEHNNNNTENIINRLIRIEENRAQQLLLDYKDKDFMTKDYFKK